MSIPLDELLKTIPGDTEEKVEQTYKRLNTNAREYMRQETRLFLNRSETPAEGRPPRDQVSVPIRLVPGLPEALRHICFGDHLWLVLMISPCRVYLKSILEGTRNAEPLLNKLFLDPRGQTLLRGREKCLPPLRLLVQDLLAVLEQEDPVRRVLEVNEDVLGAYFHEANGSRIELYWGVIGLVAAMLGVSTEALTGVVLAHELAHAYTHLGMDIDGKRWGFHSFSGSDHGLKEGLAQYYTHLVGERLDQQVSGTHDAYKELLKHQPEAYQTHTPWVQANSAEEVRWALLEIRRRTRGDIDDFTDALASAKRRLRSERSQGRLGLFDREDSLSVGDTAAEDADEEEG
jgi:hypothetical protein